MRSGGLALGALIGEGAGGFAESGDLVACEAIGDVVFGAAFAEPQHFVCHGADDLLVFWGVFGHGVGLSCFRLRLAVE